MFTGLIETVGTLHAMDIQGEERQIRIHSDLPLQTVALGDSIAVNGVCLTVTDRAQESFAVHLSAETLQRTTFAHLRVGATVNLERALALGGRLNGHLVQGHVDGIGHVEQLTPRGHSLAIGFRVDGTVGRYIVAKGSIAVDGVSLTVNTVADAGSVTRFTVNIIPHTRHKTTLALLTVNRPVNIETDLLGRYVERLLGTGGGRCSQTGGMDEAYLRDRGF
ncbi:MAG: riboflavin synthase [Magnetococcus sp. DMHC-8]